DHRVTNPLGACTQCGTTHCPYTGIDQAFFGSPAITEPADSASGRTGTCSIGHLARPRQCPSGKPHAASDFGNRAQGSIAFTGLVDAVLLHIPAKGVILGNVEIALQDACNSLSDA